MLLVLIIGNTYARNCIDAFRSSVYKAMDFGTQEMCRKYSYILNRANDTCLVEDLCTQVLGQSVGNIPTPSTTPMPTQHTHCTVQPRHSRQVYRRFNSHLVVAGSLQLRISAELQPKL